MNHFFKIIIFIMASIVQVSFAEAKDYVIPAEDPNGCIAMQSLPCAVTTGNQPRMFAYKGHSWELNRHMVMNTEKDNVWNLYKGMLVLESQGSQTLHTPFADIEVGRSKIMIHVLDKKVRVLSLDGEGVKVKPKGDPEVHYLVPGFQNWYGGVEKGMSPSGTVSVIDLEDYAKNRSQFFMNFRYGFSKELERTASIIKWATKIAAQMHRDLVERKMASLEEKHQEAILRKKRGIQFNIHLRQLFLKKVQYDY